MTQNKLPTQRTSVVTEVALQTNIVSVLDLLQKWLNCNLTTARAYYTERFRTQRLVASQIVFHRRNLETGEVFPVIRRSDILTLRSHMDIGAENRSAVHTTSTDPTTRSCSNKGPSFSSPPLNQANTHNDEKEPATKRRKTMQADLDTVELQRKISDARFKLLEDNMQRMRESAMAISALKVDDETREMLRAMALRAMGGEMTPQDQAPPIIISHMVREHLGYMPATAYNGEATAKDLYMKIGKLVKMQFQQLNGKEPLRRTYIENGVVRETNKYAANDRGWIMEIVTSECTRAGCEPRPRVLMSRGLVP
jgi:hypothetical protein